jgi:predicted DNA-binding transcriptional regulator YafY
MATNKHAIIRYHALDQCFSNTGRKYTIDDLIEASNNALCEYTEMTEGVNKRQVYYDINFMESEQGWSVPLERIRDGRRIYYRYSDRNFTIKNKGINESEANQLKETLLIFNRFKGLPQFEWIEEMLLRIDSAFNLKGGNETTVSFEQNPYLKGLEYFTQIFNAIQYRQVLKIKYQSYKQTEPVNLILHPYFLKQYNNRWFLFGLNDSYQSISNLALDRIIKVKEINRNYIENDLVDFEEYFEDVVGVTVYNNKKPVKVLLEINKERWPYIESKPLHGSQKIKAKNEDKTIIELELQLNYELESMIFSYGEDVKVISPDELRMNIINKATTLLKKYI